MHTANRRSKIWCQPVGYDLCMETGTAVLKGLGWMDLLVMHKRAEQAREATRRGWCRLGF